MKKQSISVNYILNTAYQILTLLTPLITAPYISRVLGAAGVGIYSYTSSVVAFFTMFAVLGTTSYGQRAIAQCRDDRKACSKTFWEIELLSVITTSVCIIAWFIFTAFSSEYKLYFMILTIDLASTALDVIWFYSGLERFSYIVLRNTAVRIVNIALLFLLVKTSADVWIYLAIIAVGKFEGNGSMWISLPKFIEKVSIRELNIKPHFKETMAYFIPTAAASIYTYLDKIMIGAFTTTSLENGYYEQANKIVKIAYTILVSLNTVMSARMSYLFAHHKEQEIKRRLEQSFAFIVTLGVAFGFGLAGIADNFVPWFFGAGFDKVSTLLVLLAPLALIMGLHNFLSAQYLIPSGQRVRSTKGVITGAVVNLTLNLLLIPRFQSIGAVIATLVAEISICAVYTYMSSEYVPVKLFFKYLPKQILGASVMYGIIRFIGNGYSGSSLITCLQVVCGGASYFIILLLMNETFTKSMTKQVVGKALKKVGK